MNVTLQAIGARLREVAGFLRHLWRQLLDDRCQESAAALTYLSLFAVVPLLTVSFLILSAVPEFRSLQGQLEDLVFTNFLPTTGAEVRDYLLQFAQQARKLSIPGILILITSAYLMLKNIEKTFNRIWRTVEHRRGLASFLLYWAILSLGPVLLGIGAVISTYLTSLSLLGTLGVTAEIRGTLLAWLPLLLSALTFTLIFAAVPNCRVRLSHAAGGGLLTAILFEGGKKMFTWAVSKSSYQVIYGTFAAIPLFLLWIYLSWLLILAGAEFVRALSSFRSNRVAQLPVLLVALAILERFFHAQQHGAALRESTLLRGRWLPGDNALSIETWERIRNIFLEHRLLHVTEQREFLLSRNLGNVQLSELYALLLAPGIGEHSPPQVDTSRMPAWYDRASTLIHTAESGLLSQLELPVADLFIVTETVSP